MVDILTYRHNIGCFNQIKSPRLCKQKLPKVYADQYIPVLQKYARVASYLTCVLLVCLSVLTIMNSLLYSLSKNRSENSQILVDLSPTNATQSQKKLFDCSMFYVKSMFISHKSQDMFTPPSEDPVLHLHVISRKQSQNKKSKMTYGNREVSRGLKNMHLNIRSLRYKVPEIKKIVSEHKPHIFGLSECELHNRGGDFDENLIKVPGYTTIFPSSWKSRGVARVIVYIKMVFILSKLKTFRKTSFNQFGLKLDSKEVSRSISVTFTGSTQTHWVAHWQLREVL